MGEKHLQFNKFVHPDYCYPYEGRSHMDHQDRNSRQERLVAVCHHPVTESPTSVPTETPTDSPTEAPTLYPTFAPTELPTMAPTLPTVRYQVKTNYNACRYQIRKSFD